MYCSIIFTETAPAKLRLAFEAAPFANLVPAVQERATAVHAHRPAEVYTEVRSSQTPPFVTQEPNRSQPHYHPYRATKSSVQRLLEDWQKDDKSQVVVVESKYEPNVRRSFLRR